jgi:Immunity protein 26
MRKKEKTGDLLRISLGEGRCAFCRVLIDTMDCAIYDFVSNTDTYDLGEIVKSDILFITTVSGAALQSGRWIIVDNIPLEGDKLHNFYPRYFSTAYKPGISENYYKVYGNEIEDCIKKDWIKTGKMQLDGVFDAEHVEQRINDYYNGVRNSYNTWVVIMYKNSLKLPLGELEAEKKRLEAISKALQETDTIKTDEIE